jgi:hypothetical protein
MVKRLRLPRVVSGVGSSVTPMFASSIIKGRLAALGLSNRVSARTVGFSDLARTKEVFVIVHDWKPSPIARELKELARAKGFFIDFD